MTELHPRGVFCAALTPLTADLAPDHARFTAHCRRLLDEGCDGVVLLGTTGGAKSFSTKVSARRCWRPRWAPASRPVACCPARAWRR